MNDYLKSKLEGVDTSHESSPGGGADGQGVGGVEDHPILCQGVQGRGWSSGVVPTNIINTLKCCV